MNKVIDYVNHQSLIILLSDYHLIKWKTKFIYFFHPINLTWLTSLKFRFLTF